MAGQELMVNMELNKVDAFFSGLKEELTDDNGLSFDSTAASSYINGSGQSVVPEKLQVFFDESTKEEGDALVKRLVSCDSAYQAMHGRPAPADIINQAIHGIYSTTQDANSKYSLDATATTNASLSTGLQPNRAQIAILSTFAASIPFAHYLPADIGSNEARLVILSHQAGNEYGEYVTGDILDGSASGASYISSARVHATTNLLGAHTGQLTSKQATNETCAAVGGAVVAVPLLRGRSVVYVNGQVVAQEVSAAGAGASTVSGSVTIAGVTSQIGGTINTDTGVIALTSTPALANTVPVVVEGFVDYEKTPALTPTIISVADSYKLHAKPWRVTSTQTIDSRTQMTNELGVDPYQQGIMQIQSQFAMERYYEALWKAKRIAVNNTATFDFNWAALGTYKTRSHIWQDFGSILGAVSQQMAIDTLGFGVKFLYVGKYVASQLLSLPRDLFVPSGVDNQAGVYRLGTLFGSFEVYYTPRVVTDSPTASQILCIGKAPEIARNPFVLGDAVPPMVIPLTVGADLRQGTGFFARNFTEVNPHAPSAKGAAIIDVINMGL